MVTPRILVVEDNLLTRKLLRITLQTDGYEVIESGDGESALELVASSLPALVLQDIILPDMDGFELCQRIRALPGGASLPIVALTGFMSRGDYDLLASTAFNELLIKPVEPQAVLKVVRSLLSSLPPAEAVHAVGRLLLVDDDPIQLKLHRIQLVDAGFQVFTAQNGAEALEQARQHRPDIILSDVLMPTVDGFQLSLAVRTTPELSQIPVVLCSASYVEKADEALATRMGASALITRAPEVNDALIHFLMTTISKGAPRYPIDPASFVPEHTDRVLHQLEHQTALNMRLVNRTSLQGMILSVINSLSDALSREVDLETALTEALNTILDISGVSQGAILLVDRDLGWRVGARCGLLVPEASREALAGHAELLKHVLESGESLAISAAQFFARDQMAGAARDDVEAILLVPLVSRGDKVGMLILGSNTRLFCDEEWLAFSRTMGAQIAQAIGFHHAVARMLGSEQRYRTLMENASNGIFVFRLDGIIVEANRSGEEMFGQGHGEMTGHHFTEYIAPDYVETAVGQFRALVAGDLRIARNVRVIGTGGRPATIDFSARLIELEDTAYLYGIVHDVTERNLSQQLLQERASLAALTGDVNLALATAGGLREILHRCASAVVQHLDAAFARIWTLNAAETTLELQASAGLYTHLDGAHARVKVGQLKIGRIAQERRAHLTNDVMKDPQVSQQAWAAREGMVSFAGHPLLVDGKLVGVLAMFSRHPLTDQAVTALAAVADAIAVGIQRIKSEERERLLEAQLRQSQKLEALGQLTGGIAHDFNNLLAVILVNAGFVLEGLPEDDPLRADAEEIKRGAERAAALTRQLLAVSRRQLLEPVVLDLNATIIGVETMLRRIIGEHLELTTHLARDLGRVKADPGQLEQVLMNLVVNARDAMPGGGRLAIHTANVFLDETYLLQHASVKPGPYVMFSVSDSGVGMDAETKRRIFEPFFTTKEKGKGTGLGLATTYGIVKQSGGHIWVYSEPNLGSVFKIYLPRVDDVVPHSAQRGSLRERLRGTETILLVEDDEQVRNATRRILQSLGYQVLMAQNGQEALSLFEQRSDEIQLVLSDVVMPGYSGPELLRQIQARGSHVRILLMSGYTDHMLPPEDQPPGLMILPKPFTTESLGRKVREVLEAPVPDITGVIRHP